MGYKIFIDEAGNTGSNIAKTDQPIFVLAGVMLNDQQEAAVLAKLQEQFELYKEKEELEIKGTKWSKAANKIPALMAIIDEILGQMGEIGVVILEKRYMVSAMVVDNFFDYVYNDVPDRTIFCNSQERLLAVNYYYERLNDIQIKKLWAAFRTPQSEIVLQEILNEIIEITDNVTYLTLLNGARSHLAKLAESFDDTRSCGSFLDGIPMKTRRAPNFTTFHTLGNLFIPRCTNPAELIIDKQRQFFASYKSIYDFFTTMGINLVIPIDDAPDNCIYSWNGVFTSLTEADSRTERGLQLADIIASSIKNLFTKIHYNVDKQRYNELDYYLCVILQTLETYCQTVHFVTSKDFIIHYQNAICTIAEKRPKP